MLPPPTTARRLGRVCRDTACTLVIKPTSFNPSMGGMKFWPPVAMMIRAAETILPATESSCGRDQPVPSIARAWSTRRRRRPVRRSCECCSTRRQWPPAVMTRVASSMVALFVLAACAGSRYRNNGAMARIIDTIGQAETPTITPKTSASVRKCRFVSLAI